MAITTRKFPSEFTNRGTVKTTDKVMIYNSDTGDSDEFSTVGQLTKIQDDAINALNDSKLDKSSVKNELGDSEELVMSQKGVTDEIAQLAGEVEQLAYVKIKNEAVNGNFENGLIAPFSNGDAGGRRINSCYK